MKFIVTALLLGLVVLIGAPAQARGAGRFGEEDRFVDIQRITIPSALEAQLGPNPMIGGELPLREAHLYGHFRIHWFILGAYITQHGYAIRTPASERYLELNAQETQQWQQIGLLPRPLPAWRIDPIDYLFGYADWILLAGLVIWIVSSIFFQGARAKPVEQLVGANFYAYLREAYVSMAGAGAGGVVTQSDQAVIARVLQRFGATSVADADIAEAAEAMRFKADQLTAYAAQHAGQMNPDQRSMLMHGLVLVGRDTGGMDKDRLKLLAKYLEALGANAKTAPGLARQLANDVAPA